MLYALCRHSPYPIEVFVYIAFIAFLLASFLGECKKLVSSKRSQSSVSPSLWSPFGAKFGLVFAVFSRMYFKHPSATLGSPYKILNVLLILRTLSYEIVTKMKTKPSEARPWADIFPSLSRVSIPHYCRNDRGIPSLPYHRCRTISRMWLCKLVPNLPLPFWPYLFSLFTTGTTSTLGHHATPVSLHWPIDSTPRSSSLIRRDSRDSAPSESWLWLGAWDWQCCVVILRRLKLIAGQAQGAVVQWRSGACLSGISGTASQDSQDILHPPSLLVSSIAKQSRKHNSLDTLLH